MKKFCFFIIMLLLICFASSLNIENKSTNIVISNRFHYIYDIDKDIKNGTVENIEFIDYGDVSITLEKLKMSEINLELVMSFKSENNINLDYGCAVFDNNGNIYLFNPSASNSKNTDITKEVMSFCQKHNIKYDYTWGNLNSTEIRDDDFSIIANENNIVTTKIVSYSANGFGNSNNPNLKMNRKMSDICYIEIWNLNNEIPLVIELNLPNDFYTNSQIEFEQITKNKKFKLNKAVCDDTSFLFIAEVYGFYDTMKNFTTTNNGKTDIDNLVKWYDGEIDKYIYISDENGNNYYISKEKSFSYIPIKKLDRITFTFDITSDVVTSKLFVNLLIDNKKEVIELNKQS